MVYVEPPTVRSRVSMSIRGSGMTTTVGRLRPCGVLDWKFTVLSHNTIRGAAGAALTQRRTAAKSQGYLE